MVILLYLYVTTRPRKIASRVREGMPEGHPGEAPDLKSCAESIPGVADLWREFVRPPFGIFSKVNFFSAIFSFSDLSAQNGRKDTGKPGFRSQ